MGDEVSWAAGRGRGGGPGPAAHRPPESNAGGVRSGAGPPTGSPKQPSRLGAADMGSRGCRDWCGWGVASRSHPPRPGPVPAEVLTQEGAELWNGLL